MNFRRAVGIGRPWSGDSARRGTVERRSRGEVTSLLHAIEEQVKADSNACFELSPDGAATLNVEQGRFHAGTFTTPTLTELRKRVAARPPLSRGRVRLSILLGDGSETDIGSLQATAPSGVLFQAASQFNCLEAPGASVTAVAHYTSDNTQGPRASVSAFPGTFLRHYYAPRPSGERFTQTNHDGINLLADALPAELARVQSGYLTTQNIRDLSAAASSLEAAFEQIRVGVLDEVEVVCGADWGGAVPDAPQHRIAQAFTSTLALGGYGSHGGEGSERMVRQLQRAAYLGTLLAALERGKHTAVLTMIGGGVFGNPLGVIWEAIHWSIDEVSSYGHALDVLVNTRLDAIDEDNRARALASGGQVFALHRQR